MPIFNPFSAASPTSATQAAQFNPFQPTANGAQSSIPELLAGLGMIALRNERAGSPLVQAAQSVFQRAEQQRQFQRESALESQRQGALDRRQQNEIDARFGLAGFQAGVEDARASEAFRRRLLEGRVNQGYNLETLGVQQDFQGRENALNRGATADLQNQRLAFEEPLQNAQTNAIQQRTAQDAAIAPLQQDALRANTEYTQAQTAALDPKARFQERLKLIQAETESRIKEAGATGVTERNIATAREASARAFQSYLGETAPGLTPTQQSNITDDVVSRAEKVSAYATAAQYGPEGLVTYPDGRVGYNFKNADQSKFFFDTFNRLQTEQSDIIDDPTVKSLINVFTSGQQQQQQQQTQTQGQQKFLGFDASGNALIKDVDGQTVPVPRDFYEANKANFQ